MQQLTDVVKHLLIINVLIYFAAQLLGQPSYGVNIIDQGQLGWARLAMYYPSSPFFEPFQIVTHMFMHGSVGHLFFNMIGLYFFGPPLEYRFGAKRFLFYYLFAGFGALLIHLGVVYAELNFLGAPAAKINSSVVGASGAIMGLLIGYALKYPDSIVALIFPPIQMKAKYFALAYVAFDLFAGFGSFNTGIAHFAHLGGALFGFILIKYWDKFDPRI